MGSYCSSCSDKTHIENTRAKREPILTEVISLLACCFSWLETCKIVHQKLKRTFYRNKRVQFRTFKQMEWLAKSLCLGLLNESQSTVSSKKSMDLSNFEKLFEELGKFMKTLPPKSRKYIWDHAVTEKKGDDNTKKVIDKTTDQEQITRLLCDCVIVFIKYLNRNEKPLKSKSVLPYVEPAARWIFDNYGELERLQFELETNYFADILAEYQVQLLCLFKKKLTVVLFTFVQRMCFYTSI
ncbi:hypothetical protein RFI_21238 [Reticulomyxa filosa]|uniref:Uncharacterized protein n=1 Tax=Reticulomyxa filosa TaxID=46433 RepID=X6MQ36_RETFI|nr:hypothetical protein RFI_21238 [Reticulomyxa filosa]|eukprot:ETO16118.1 hypothetical protein RFI_21238 [Reticulomyxa filosa]